jgi:hypothetical protein
MVMKVRGEPSKPEVTSRRLCIVGRDRHLSGEFVASFTTALGAREEFEIIVDRRHGDPAAGPPDTDRRVRQHVTRALERDGFAIVAPFESRAVQDEQLQCVEGLGTSLIERLGLEDGIGASSLPPRPGLAVAETPLGAESAEPWQADERRLERILEFNRRRRARLRRRWILIGVLVALPVLSLVATTFVSRTRSVELSPLDGSRAPESLRRSVAAPSGEAPTMTGPTRSASGSRQTGALSGSSLHVRMPQVHLTRKPASASDGGGEAYGVRLADSRGRPLAGAEVFLLIRTADSTLLDLALRAGANPGTYSITVPPLRSAPIDLRLRLVTNNTRVEIPLMP